MGVAGVLSYLETLVAFDTQNPPRALSASSPIFSWITEVLGPRFNIELIDHGERQSVIDLVTSPTRATPVVVRVSAASRVSIAPRAGRRA